MLWQDWATFLHKNHVGASSSSSPVFGLSPSRHQAYIQAKTSSGPVSLLILSSRLSIAMLRSLKSAPQMAQVSTKLLHVGAMKGIPCTAIPETQTQHPNSKPSLLPVLCSAETEVETAGSRMLVKPWLDEDLKPHKTGEQRNQHTHTYPV